MKVILLKDIPKIGKKYDMKTVSDGYALNMLIPRGLAEAATDSVVKRVELEKARHDAERKVHEDLLAKNLKDIDGKIIEMVGKANEKGHLFAGIHTSELVPEIQKQTRIQINPEFILLPKPIKEVGEHDIKVHVNGKSARFKLVIKAL